MRFAVAGKFSALDAPCVPRKRAAVSADIAPNRAVFLSYATQDAAEARRICEALRAAGVEVWFDQSELRGGDAWDRKIRTQIRDCALFLPLISANTQARLEGYFRLEWKLAEDRSHLMAKGKPFLVPVVVDATGERDAHVPDAFLAVQWTRLAGGETNAAFCAQVQRLLGNSEMEPGRPRRDPELGRMGPGERGEGAASPAGMKVGRALRARRFGPAAIAAAVVLTLAAGAWIWRTASPASDPAARRSAPPTVEKSAPAPTAPAAISDKSLVVLPLENLSPDPENAFFTDGMHHEIISTLQTNADLKVASRSAALAYKGSTRPIAAIARELGVANVITGSVRRERDRVRIQLELRRAGDDALLWALPKLDRPVIDAFAVQTEVAEEVSRVLQARAGVGRGGFAQFMTRNPRAYDLYLKALNDYLNDGYFNVARLNEDIVLMTEAVQLDPAFMPAARMLGRLHARTFGLSRESQDLLHHAAEAKRWSETASRLAPGGAGDAALAQYYAIIMGDGERALTLAQSAIRALPNDPDGYIFAGAALRLLGRRTEAAVHYRRAAELDAGVPQYWSFAATELIWLRRWDELKHLLSGRKNTVAGPGIMAQFQLDGTLPAPGKIPAGNSRAAWHWRRREFTEVIAAVEAGTFSDSVKLDQLGRKSDALRRLGRTGEAEAVAREMIVVAERLQAAPDFGPSPKAGYQAQAWLRTGRTEDALAAARRFIDAVPESNAGTRWAREITLAEMLAYLNRSRESCELIAKLLRVPSGLTVPMLKVDPTWDNVREDVAFKALLADPKNSAPL